MDKEYRELYFKDMSPKKLSQLYDYGFKRVIEKEWGSSIYWQFPADTRYGSINLYEEYWTDPETKYEDSEEILITPSELIKCNGEFNLDDGNVVSELTVEALEVICKLYKDGLVEFRNTKGTSYQIQKGLV